MTLSELEKACRELREKTGHDMAVVLFNQDDSRTEEVVGIEKQIFEEVSTPDGPELLVYAMLESSGKDFL